MKFVFIAIAAFLFLIGANSQTVSGQYPSGTIIFTSSNSIPISLSTGSQFYTNNIEFALYHTIHVAITGSDTNQIARVGIDRSLDNINWVIVGTNSNTALVTTSLGETTMTGKWAWIRYRVYGTNVSGSINYLGGR